jgi:hypothetical protein
MLDAAQRRSTSSLDVYEMPALSRLDDFGHLRVIVEFARES